MDVRTILLTMKHNKIMAVLMVLQIALTMAVLSVAVLKTATTLAEWNLPSGIPHDDIIRIGAEFYDDNQDVGAAMQRDLERIRSLSGVEQVTRTNGVPFEMDYETDVYTSTDENAERQTAQLFEADIHFLSSLQLGLLEGRAFTALDEVIAYAEQGIQATNVMVSEDMAKKLFPEESAVGKTVWFSKGSDPVQIIGMFSNFMGGERYNAQGRSYDAFIRPQVIWGPNKEPEYLVRVGSGQAEGMIEDLVNAFYQERYRYVFASERLSRVQKRMYDGRGSRAVTELVIAATLMLITSFGIAGLTSFQVNQRRKQIGTRRALGARRSDIIRYFLTENAIICLVGLFLGSIATVYLAYDMSVRDEQKYFDFTIIVSIAALMWAVSALSTWLPARKATQVSPAIVTRGG